MQGVISLSERSSRSLATAFAFVLARGDSIDEWLNVYVRRSSQCGIVQERLICYLHKLIKAILIRFKLLIQHLAWMT
jgi:hypothetical protein